MRKPIRERECYFWDSKFRTHTLAAGEFDLVSTLRGIDGDTEFHFVCATLTPTTLRSSNFENNGCPS